MITLSAIPCLLLSFSKADGTRGSLSKGIEVTGRCGRGWNVNGLVWNVLSWDIEEGVKTPDEGIIDDDGVDVLVIVGVVVSGVVVVVVVF